MAAPANFKSKVVNETNAGDKEIVAAVTGKKIAVYGYWLHATMAGTVRWEDGAGGTALTGIMNLAADVPMIGISPIQGVPLFTTTAATALSMELTGTGDIDGHILYAEVD